MENIQRIFLVPRNILDGAVGEKISGRQILGLDDSSAKLYKYIPLNKKELNK